MSDQWITVPRWDEFQHRDAARATVPTWLKLYTELGSKDEFLALSFHLRGVLVSIWVEYARSKRQLRDNTLGLTRRLGHRVTRRDIERLNHAGFIQLSASRPASTPAGIPASLEKKREEEKEHLTFNGRRENPREAYPPQTTDELAILQAAYDPQGEPAGLAQLRATIAAARAADHDPDDIPF